MTTDKNKGHEHHTDEARVDGRIDQATLIAGAKAAILRAEAGTLTFPDAGQIDDKADADLTRLQEAVANMTESQKVFWFVADTNVG